MTYQRITSHQQAVVALEIVPAAQAEQAEPAEAEHLLWNLEVNTNRDQLATIVHDTIGREVAIADAGRLGLMITADYDTVAPIIIALATRGITAVLMRS